MSIKLSDLNARFVGAGGDGVSDANGNPVPERKGIGVAFDCPCGRCDEPNDWVFVAFRNPIDGGPPPILNTPLWDRTGDTIDTLTLSPSIQRTDVNGCKWHGFVRNGCVETV